MSGCQPRITSIASNASISLGPKPSSARCSPRVLAQAGEGKDVPAAAPTSPHPTCSQRMLVTFTFWARVREDIALSKSAGRGSLDDHVYCLNCEFGE